MTVTKYLKKAIIPNDYLLDIGINIDLLAWDEIIFFKDRLNERVKRIC